MYGLGDLMVIYDLKVLMCSNQLHHIILLFSACMNAVQIYSSLATNASFLGNNFE